MWGLLPTAVFCGVSLCAFGQPGIGQNGVVNTASRIPPTLPGGALARGSRFTITGVRFEEGHTTVTLAQKEISTQVHLIQVSGKRIEAIVPAAAALGPSSLIVSVSGLKSKPFPIDIASFNPGIYSVFGEGWGPGRIMNLDVAGKGSPNTEENPTRPGQTISLLVTGMGAETGATVNIGGRPVRTSAVRKTAKPGEQLLVAAVPRDVPQGCFVPVYLEVAPKRASNVVTMAVSGTKGSCDSGPVPLLTENRIGLVGFDRISLKSPRAGAEDQIYDGGFVIFAEKNNLPMRTLVPPPGTCTGYTTSFQSGAVPGNSLMNTLTNMQTADESHATQLDTVLLDAGTLLRLTRVDPSTPKSPIVRTMEVQSVRFRAMLGTGGSATRRGLPEPFFGAGEVTLRSVGGADVPEFSVHPPMPVSFEWTDREQIREVDRARGVTVHWKSEPGIDSMLIAATNIDQLTTASATVVCAARPSDGQMEIPAALLANFPASQEMSGVPYERLYVGSVKATALHIPEITSVAAWGVFSMGRIVSFR